MVFNVTMLEVNNIRNQDKRIINNVDGDNNTIDLKNFIDSNSTVADVELLDKLNNNLIFANLMNNKIFINRLNDLLRTRFNNDINALSEYLNRPVDVIQQMLSGELKPDNSIAEKIDPKSAEYIQFGENSKIIVNQSPGETSNYFDSCSCDKGELHALRLKIRCLEELVDTNEKHLSDMRNVISDIKNDHLREVETLKSIIETLKHK